MPTARRPAPCRSLILPLILLLPCAHSMRLVIQRVKSASVTVKESGNFLHWQRRVALVGLHVDDTEEDMQYCAKKLLSAKLWPNENDKPWRQSVKQLNHDVLLVSQFTLYGSIANKKSCPDFKYSMKSDPALSMYSKFKDIVSHGYGAESASKVKDGEFGAMMDVALVNDGPVTLVIDSREDQGP